MRTTPGHYTQGDQSNHKYLYYSVVSEDHLVLQGGREGRYDLRTVGDPGTELMRPVVVGRP